MAFLTPDRVRTEHGLTIYEKIIPWGAVWSKDDLSSSSRSGDPYKADRLLSNGSGKPQWITVHNTADIQEAAGTDDAEQYTRATWPNQNMGEVRVHYYIDESSCWQNLREDEVGWHAGDGNYGTGNDTSLAVEIIMSGRGDEADLLAEERGALLTALLMQRHGLDLGHVVPHKRWNGKQCPAYILPHWDAFLEKVSQLYRELSGGDSEALPPTSEPTPEQTLYRIQVGAYSSQALAVSAASRLELAGYPSLIEEEDGWYKVRTGLFASRAAALEQANLLREQGFDTFLAVQKPSQQKEDAFSEDSLPLKPGDQVRVVRGAKTYSGGHLASFVYDTVYTVMQNKGDRVVIGINGIVTAAVRRSDLIPQP